MGVNPVLAVDESADVVYRQTECLRLAVSRNDILLVLGIQAFNLIHSDAANIRDLFEMQVAVHLYGIRGVRNIGFHRADVVLAVVRHYVVGGYKSGYVSACFFGQIVVYFPIIRFAACAPDGFVDGAGTAVVGGDYQVPVLVDGIHIFQVACGGPGSLNRVAAFVHKAVAFQTVYLAGVQHELPQAGGSGAGYGRGVKRRLDNRQIFQFQRQPVGVERLFENGHVEVAGAQHESHLVAEASGIHVDEFAYNLVVGHFHNGRHAREPVDVYGIAELGIDGRGAAILP